MNKSIKIEIALGVIVVIAIVAGAAVWFSGNETAQAPMQIEKLTQPVVQPKKQATTPTKENVDACNGIKQITDSRDADNPVYLTVAIGTQCWLGRNLNIGTKVDSVKNQTDNNIIEKYCDSNKEANCLTDGGLYQWEEAMQYAKNEGAQGLCPIDWHIPSDSEWAVLENYLVDAGKNCEKDRVTWDCATVGDKLRKGGSSDFNAIFAGYRALYGVFPHLERSTAAHFWSSTKSVPESGWDVANPGAWARHLYFENSTMQRDHYWQTVGFSVRCIKD